MSVAARPLRQRQLEVPAGLRIEIAQAGNILDRQRIVVCSIREVVDAVAGRLRRRSRLVRHGRLGDHRQIYTPGVLLAAGAEDTLRWRHAVEKLVGVEVGATSIE